MRPEVFSTSERLKVVVVKFIELSSWLFSPASHDVPLNYIMPGRLALLAYFAAQHTQEHTQDESTRSQSRQGHLGHIHHRLYAHALGEAMTTATGRDNTRPPPPPPPPPPEFCAGLPS